MTSGTVARRAAPAPELRAALTRGRLVALGVGLAAGAALAALDQWLWAPLPCLAAWLAWQASPTRRALEQAFIRVRDGHIEVPGRPPTPLATATAALAWREPRQGHDLLEIVVWADGAPARVTLHVDASATTPGAIDVERAEAALGGLPGWRQALPGVATTPFHDPDAGVWSAVVAALPEAARDAHRARAWRGPAPQVDVTGVHVADATDVVVLGTTPPPDAPRVDGLVRIRRPQPVLGGGERRPRRELLHVDLLGVLLSDGRVLAFPCAAAATLPEAPDGPHVLHLHAVEAAALLGGLCAAPGGGALAARLPDAAVLAPDGPPVVV